MSRTYSLPILFGSRAADIGGFLPSGKDTQNLDYDILTTIGGLGYFEEITGRMPIEHATGRATLSASNESMFDIDVASEELYEAIGQACTETVTVQWSHFQFQFILATAEIVWITRGITAGYVPSKLQQALEDTVHYGKLPLKLTDDHLRVIELVLRSSPAKRLRVFNKMK